MSLDLLVAAAKERLHRSIGQRARFAKAAIAAKARDPRFARERPLPDETGDVIVFRRPQPYLTEPTGY